MPIIQLPNECPGLENGISITKGSSKSIEITTGQDLAGKTVSLIVKRSKTSNDILITVAGVKLPPAETGQVRFDFTSVETGAVAAGIYYFTIEIVGADTEVFTNGVFKLEPYDQAFVGLIEPVLGLGIVGSTERVYLEIRDRNGVLANPNTIRVQAFDSGDNALFDYDFPSSQINNPQAGIFSVDVVSNLVGDFLVIWTTKFNDEESTKTIKNVRFVSSAMFRIMPEVRAYIDKAQKAIEKTIGYKPADIAIYIENAIRDFNAYPPLTGICLENFPNEFKSILILGTVIQALIAQGLLAVDQDFQYNDNGISLNIDHSTKLLGWFQALLQMYLTQKKLAKMNYAQGAVYARSIVGSAYLGITTKAGPGTLARFRGWL